MPISQHGWKRRIFNAIASDRLGVTVQAIEAIPADAITRQELLLHLTEGDVIVPAGQWIDAANSSAELMCQLDRWVLSWLFNRHGLTNQYWVNVSAYSLEDAGYSWFVAEQLERGTLTAAQICIEITEQAQTGTQSIATLKALRGFGCHIAIDDFGSGYNSARKLVDFPITGLKLTGDLCRDVEQERQAQILEAFIGMGLQMGLDVVVEWVESQAQFDLLSGFGAKLFQGWHFGRGRPIIGPRESWQQNLEPLRVPLQHPPSHHPASSRTRNIAS